MLYEDLRLIHEDVERLESAIAERYLENPKQVSSSTTGQTGQHLHLIEQTQTSPRS